jgi:hypothetical protein
MKHRHISGIIQFLERYLRHMPLRYMLHELLLHAEHGASNADIPLLSNSRRLTTVSSLNYPTIAIVPKGASKPHCGYRSAAVCIGFFHPQNLGITLWIEVWWSSQTLPLEPNAYFLGTRDAQRCQAKLLSFRRNFTSAKSVFVCHRHNTPSITYALAE